MSVRVHVFGRLRVDVGDVALSSRDADGRGPRQVLQILAAHHGRTVSKDRLADLLWCDEPPADPGGSVQHYVAVLRRRLRMPGDSGPSVVAADASGYRLDIENVWVDLAQFRCATADLATWLDLSRVREALRMSEGEAFADEPDSDWAVEVRQEVAGCRSDLLVRAAELGLADGDPASAARDAADAIVIEPHLEPAHRALMAAHYVHGDQARALAAYRQLRDRLVVDLGVEPTPHTRALHDAVLHHSRTDDVLRRLTVPQGLRSA
jgi:DNA-binding SARP family transcriptional activator